MITLTTDFQGDYYVAEMRGVIDKVNEKSRIVDVTHTITRHSIIEGSFILSRIWRHFPSGTIHVGIVDPDVGGDRNPIAVETDYCFFVGPDNGLFSLALENQRIKKIVEIDAANIRKTAGLDSKIADTFHGRDIFAPAAALLDKGQRMENLGRLTEELHRLRIPDGTVLHVDGFGNIVVYDRREFNVGDKLNIRHDDNNVTALFAKTFSYVKEGEVVVLKGSHGFLEVDVNQGSAAEKLGVNIGDTLIIENAV